MAKKNKEFDISVHYNVQGRKRFKRRMWLYFLILLVILCACGVMFYFANMEWDPDAGFRPAAVGTHWWQILLVVLGGVIAVGCMVGYVVCMFKIMSKFYKSQIAYMKTKEFRERKAKALSVEVTHLKKSDIKWLKKLCYITSSEKNSIMEKMNAWKKDCKKNHKKVNYAKSLA